MAGENLILARYLACLQNRLAHLPTRKQRRALPSTTARAIVLLQSSTFTTILSILQQRYNPPFPIPPILYRDPHVNALLLKLEDSMIARRYPWPDGPLAFRLDWSQAGEGQGQGQGMPLPILGLEFTLGMYFGCKGVDLLNVYEVDLRERDLTCTPRCNPCEQCC